MSSRSRLIGNQNITVGTVELGDTFGQVVSGTVSTMVDEEEVPDALDNTQAVIQAKLRKEFNMETVWDTSSAMPAMGDSLTLPSGEVAIVNKCEEKWSAGKSKGFTVDATWRESMGNEPLKSWVTLNP